MSDISTVWDTLFDDNAGTGDWKMSGPDFLTGNDLQTAVLISLFSDRVAQSGDIIPDGTNDPRGWWADNKVNGTSDPIGSRLWLLAREKAPTQEVLNKAITYAREALQWMVNDGVAALVSVQAEWNASNFLAMKVTITRKNGTVVPINFTWAWQQLVSK